MSMKSAANDPNHWSNGRTVRVLRNVVFGCLAVVIAIVTWANLQPAKPLAGVARPAEISAADAQRIDHALRMLADACPALSTYAADLYSARASIAEGLFEERALDWRRPVEISVVVAKAPSKIPSSFAAEGHTLRYVVGASAKASGVTADKPASRAFCRETQARVGDRALIQVANAGALAN